MNTDVTRQPDEGPWFVWGDGIEAHLEDVSEAVARAKVDQLHAAGDDTVYAENNDTGETYEGPTP